jgi:2'-5' RNA ligase
VPPAGLVHQLRAVRDLVGGPAGERIVPHVTVVPPFNLGSDGYPELRRTLRDAATATEPFDLTLGPVSSFAPQNPTLHLRVGGGACPGGPLDELWRRLRRGPMDRPVRHPFVPHLTLRRRTAEEVTDAAPLVLPGVLRPWGVDRLQLLEQLHVEAETVWRTVAEEPFGGPVVVGRGGVELALRTIGVVEPLLGSPEPLGGPADDGEALVVVAERPGSPGEVVARSVGFVGAGVARLCEVVVSEEQRGMGIARQVVARWCTDAARSGATVAVGDAAGGEVLAALGFSQAGQFLVRKLADS